MRQAKYMQVNSNAKTRGNREKAVYARERKALKTIGIIVCGFVACWLPFFVIYIVEVRFVWSVAVIQLVVYAQVFIPSDAAVLNSSWYQTMGAIFLFLGYSNSALNPIIYTFCNGDFRRCFKGASRARLPAPKASSHV